MWWGNGDSSRLDESEKVTLSHLRRLVETGHVVSLEPRRADVAVRAVEFYDNWESVLKLLNSFKNIALLVGAILAIWWATEGWIVQFIQNASGAGQ